MKTPASNRPAHNQSDDLERAASLVVSKKEADSAVFTFPREGPSIFSVFPVAPPRTSPSESSRMIPSEQL